MRLVKRLLLILAPICVTAQVDPPYPTTPSVAQNIDLVEYYVDTDPGLGLGTAIPIAAGPDVVLNTASISTSGLSNGVHTVFLRSKEKGGEWSQTSSRTFLIEDGYISPPAIAQNIVSAEYFFDTDPGYGAANALLITPDVDVSLSNISLNTTGLSPGIHYLYVRTEEALNTWSQTSMREIEVVFDPAYPAILSTPSNITEAEYFIDADPGFGSGTSILLAAGQDMLLANVNIDVMDVPPGIHHVFIRTKNTDGQWSQTGAREFEVLLDPAYPEQPAALANIVAAEYFVNEDPGIGLATNIPLTSGIYAELFDIHIDVSGLPSGFHTVYVRTKDANSHWSLTSVQEFEVIVSQNRALDFDGVDDEVVVSENSELQFGQNDFSIEARIYFDGTDQSGTIVGKRNPFLPSEQIQLRIGSGLNQPEGKKVEAYILTDGRAGSASEELSDRVVTASSNLSVGWHHLAMVQEYGTGLTLYIDGILSGTDSDDHAGKSINVIGKDVFIGSFGGGGYFEGAIDEVRVWNRALCQSEIQGRMNARLQGNENGLVAYFDFEEGIPNTDNSALIEVKDKAAMNHGSMHGFAKTGTKSNWSAGSSLTPSSFITGNQIIWNGSFNADWNTASNWTPADVPAHCSDVVIPATANNPVFSDNQAVNSIEIQTNAALTAEPGGCLWVGSAFENNGQFVLKSNNTNYAQYQGPQVKATLEQVIAEEGWHSIASPFTNSELEDISFSEGAFLNFDADPEKSNVHYYDPSVYQSAPPLGWTNAWGTWVPAAGIQDPFDGTRGYNVYFDEYFMSGSFPIIMRVTGILRNMPITQELNGANGGWNQLSNSFPSIIAWDKLHDNSTIASDAYYVWSAADNNYATYSDISSSGTFGSTNYIAPYQSVFVRTANGSDASSGPQADNFQYHMTSNADRPTECPAVINGFYKTSPLPGNLKLETSNSLGLKDELILVFNESALSTYSQAEDVSKFFSSEQHVPSLFAEVENQACVIASYPTPDLRAETISLGYSSTKGGAIRIEATEIPEGMTVILEDLELKSFHNLETRYAFTTENEEETDRFKLHVGGENSNINSIFGGDQIVYTQDQTLVFYDNEALKGGKLLLFNSAGQELVIGSISEDMQIDVSSYAPGIYLIQVNTRGVVKTQRVVVQ